MIAYILIGLPASGKSTWAKIKTEALKRENIGVRIVNNDNIRNAIYLMRKSDIWSPEVEKQVKRMRETQISFAFENKEYVIVDNTHMNPKTLKQTKDFCKSLGYEIEEVDFRDISVEECVERDKNRSVSERVGEKVIREMANKFMSKTLPKWKHFDELPSCIIVDIDGTLADCTDKRSPYDETKVLEDEPRVHVVFTVGCMLQAKLKMSQNDCMIEDDMYAKLFIFSGRTEGCRADTEKWLKEKTGLDRFGYTLVMRKVGDSRRDSIVKREFYKENIEDKYSVIAVFDDRPQVIRELWKPLELPVFNCGLIDVEF